MKALILTGLQVDFFSLGAAEINGAEEILPTINEWMPRFDHVVAARFSHPAEHKMFVANYPWRRPGQEVDLLGDKIILRNYYCIQDSFGAELTMGIDHEKITHTVWMGTDQKVMPRSAFYDDKKEKDLGLKKYLSKNNIQEIYLAGLPFEEGILQTAMDGLEEGFSIKVLIKGIKEKNTTLFAEGIIQLRKMGAEIIE